jgi:hypothetical protein
LSSGSLPSFSFCAAAAFSFSKAKASALESYVAPPFKLSSELTSAAEGFEAPFC